MRKISLTEIAPSGNATRFGSARPRWSKTREAEWLTRECERLGLTAAQASRRLGLTTGELADAKSGRFSFNIDDASPLLNAGGHGPNKSRAR